MKLEKYVIKKLKRIATIMLCLVQWIAARKVSSISKEDIYVEDFKSNRKELIYARITWVNPIQDGSFLGCSEMGGGQKAPPHSIESVTHILQWWNLAQLYLT